MMSKKFNKTLCSDFNLYEKNGKYFSNYDESEWIPCFLYDFGWGRENGFYKVPLGDFYDLIKIVLDKNDEEDSYAASSIIVDKYSYEFKLFLLDIIQTNRQNVDYERLNVIFKLDVPINRTIKDGMDLKSIEKEYSDWELISRYFKKAI